MTDPRFKIISLKDLILNIKIVTKSKGNEFTMFINITFLLLDYITNFTFKNKSSKLVFKNSKPKKPESLSHFENESLPQTVTQINQIQLSERSLQKKLDSVNSKTSTNTQLDANQIQINHNEENEEISNSKILSTNKNHLLVDIKNVYANIIIIFFGNFHLSHQYNIKVIPLTNRRKKLNSYSKLKIFHSHKKSFMIL